MADPLPIIPLPSLLTIASPPPASTHQPSFTRALPFTPPPPQAGISFQGCLPRCPPSPNPNPNPNPNSNPNPNPNQAGISFQGCLYSFVFCLLVFAWSAYEAAQTPLCVLTLTSMALATAYFMMARTKQVEIWGD